MGLWPSCWKMPERTMPSTGPQAERLGIEKVGANYEVEVEQCALIAARCDAFWQSGLRIRGMDAGPSADGSALVRI